MKGVFSSITIMGADKSENGYVLRKTTETNN